MKSWAVKNTDRKGKKMLLKIAKVLKAQPTHFLNNQQLYLEAYARSAVNLASELRTPSIKILAVSIVINSVAP